jgi:hypothetical protein
MKNIKLIIFIIIFCAFYTTNAWVNWINNSKVDISIPTYVWKLAWSYIDDINFWKDWVVEQDRNFNEYLVIPSNWLVVPINHVEKDNPNYSNIDKIDINNYLQNWALSYPWNDQYNYWYKWNIVLFWHSSYWESDIWRYKTHFQKIIWLSIWKEIWIYKKQTSWEWKRFKYIVEKSYEASPTDVSVIRNIWKKELTLFTCTPIWWIHWRWVIKAIFIPEQLKSTDKLVIKINNKFFKKIIKIQDTNEKNKLILQINDTLEKLSKDYEMIIKIQKEFKILFWVEYL